MSNPENASERQEFLHDEALHVDRVLAERVRQGMADSYGEAIRHLEDEAAMQVDQERLLETAAACDAILHIDADTTTEGKPKRSFHTQLGEGVEVTALLFKHPRVAREYFISYPSPREPRLRRDTILVVRKDGRLHAAVNEETTTADNGWEGVILTQEYATDADLEVVQRQLAASRPPPSRSRW